MSEATIPIQDALYEACSELALPRKTTSFKEDRSSAPIDILDASLEEMLFLEGIGEVSARKIIAIRETWIPLTMDIWGENTTF